MMDYTSCPACSHGVAYEVKGFFGVRRCARCGAIFGQCYLGDSYILVRPQWSLVQNVPNAVYFDLTCLGSNGIERRHGWFDPATRLITQVG